MVEVPPGGSATTGLKGLQINACKISVGYRKEDLDKRDSNGKELNASKPSGANKEKEQDELAGIKFIIKDIVVKDFSDICLKVTDRLSIKNMGKREVAH
jgi:hypothetical protein